VPVRGSRWCEPSARTFEVFLKGSQSLLHLLRMVRMAGATSKQTSMLIGGLAISTPQALRHQSEQRGDAKKDGASPGGGGGGERAAAARLAQQTNTRRGETAAPHGGIARAGAETRGASEKQDPQGLIVVRGDEVVKAASPPQRDEKYTLTAPDKYKSFMEMNCPWDTSDVSFRPARYVPRRDLSIRSFTNDRPSAGRPGFYRELGGWNRLG
jgi:hypothetical protein